MSAGKLLYDIGSKEISFGGASVFAKHANILLNEGMASSDDIRRLATMLKTKVKDKFGIELTEEIILLGVFVEESI